MRGVRVPPAGGSAGRLDAARGVTALRGPAEDARLRRRRSAAEMSPRERREATRRRAHRAGMVMLAV